MERSSKSLYGIVVQSEEEHIAIVGNPQDELQTSYSIMIERQDCSYLEVGLQDIPQTRRYAPQIATRNIVISTSTKPNLESLED